MTRNEKKVLKYDEPCAHAVRHIILTPFDFIEGTSMTSICYLCSCLNMLEVVQPSETPDIDKAFEYFYACCEASRHRADLCPVPDFCLLTYNLLSQQYTLRGMHIVCLDVSLLPVAILASVQGATVTLTEEDGIEAIFKLLQRTLPQTTWRMRNPQDILPAHTFVLGEHPAKLLESGKLGLLQEIDGGVLFAFWDFLGVETQAYAREKWLASGLIKTVIQLPRPRRQSAGYYPALIELGASTTVKLVFFDAHTTKAGAGAWDQEKVLSLLYDTNSTTLDMPIDALTIKGLPDLTPRMHLARKDAKILTSSLRLGDVAHIIRCQMQRVKMDDDTSTEILAHMDSYYEQAGGLLGNGSFMCREVSLASIDHFAGFMDDKGDIVTVAGLNPERMQGKYILRQHDIVMVFRGTEPSLGRVGYVEFEGELPAITGQSLCIIRASTNAVDPVWLYYYLREFSVRMSIIHMAVGSRMLTINLSDLRGIHIPCPSIEEVTHVHQKHRQIVDWLHTMRTLQYKIRQCSREVHESMIREHGFYDGSSV